jgi:very-short-patch-repair endonuclease
MAPQWLAFYQTKVFQQEAFSVRYFGRVRSIRKVLRGEIFPDELPNPKSDRVYYQIFLESLERRPLPIVSYRLRLIVFIATTWHKLMTAVEINDLIDDSPLEDALWSEMKKLEMRAERQFYVEQKGDSYCLDFALFCQNGKLEVETDGDKWHADPDRIPYDNRRNNALAAQGWQVLRFNTSQVREEMTEYCVPQIVKTVNKLGGMEETDGTPRMYYATEDGVVQQLGLFEEC